MPSVIHYFSVERVRMVYNQTTSELDAHIRLVGQKDSGPIPTGIKCSHSDFRSQNKSGQSPAVQDLIRAMIDWERSILAGARLLSEARQPVSVEALLFARTIPPTLEVVKVAGAFASLSIRFSFRKARRSTDQYGSVGVVIRIGNRINQSPLPTGVHCRENEWTAYQKVEPKPSRLLNKLKAWQEAIQSVTQALLLEEAKITPHLIHERALALTNSNHA